MEGGGDRRWSFDTRHGLISEWPSHGNEPVTLNTRLPFGSSVLSSREPKVKRQQQRHGLGDFDSHISIEMGNKRFVWRPRRGPLRFVAVHWGCDPFFGVIRNVLVTIMADQLEVHLRLRGAGWTKTGLYHSRGQNPGLLSISKDHRRSENNPDVRLDV